MSTNDGLGLNRLGDTILCKAWGETDRPHVMLAKSKSDVAEFICDQWIDDALDPLLAEILTELEKHDWSEDRTLQYDFEIGGISFEDMVMCRSSSDSYNYDRLLLIANICRSTKHRDPIKDILRVCEEPYQ